MCNLDAYAKEMMVKLRSISLCSNTVGQVMTDLKINPPSKRMGETDQSIEQYESEKSELFNSLKRRAEKCQDALNSMDNIDSQQIEGALYAFPSIKLSNKFLAEAKERGVAGDF